MAVRARSSTDPLLAVAMVSSGAITAQYLIGKAIRDGIYFSQFDKTTFWKMMLATSAVSIALSVANARATSRLSPSRLVPALFVVSAALFIAEWVFLRRAPGVVAIWLFLHISGLGPMLGSGFWLIASERFDPRTVKKRVGQIAAAGTLVGVLGGLVTVPLIRALGTASMLPILAAINVLCAWQTWRLAGPAPARGGHAPSTISGFKVLADAPYLQTLALMLVLGTMSAMLFDFLFKGAAQDALKSRDALSDFFATYYAAVGFGAFVLQTSSSRQVLERFGLRAAVSSPSVALLAGGVGTLAIPGLASAVAVRGAESACRVSLFRAGYELFYAPIAPAEKRAVKSIIDVGADRLGDAAASGLIPLLLFAPPAIQRSAIVWVGIACSALALVLARRLNRGYIQALERSLLDRALDVDLSDVEDRTTRETILRTLHRPTGVTGKPPSVDADVVAILALRSGDPDAARRVLHDEHGLSATLVPHAIPLLARSSLAADTIRALRKTAEERVGALVDALLDPNQDFVVRRRLARVFSICVSQRAVDGLLLALDDLRFEVRFQCARSLAVIVERNRAVSIDHEQVLAAVQREVKVARAVWDGRRLLDDVSVGDPPAAVDEFAQPRTAQSLIHVFTLLSLVLPREPLHVAFRGLNTDDGRLRGTALEYLENTLPPPIRQALWPLLEAAPASASPIAAKVDAGL
jgi:AAA family ATP:ADP antiporter